MKTLHTYISEKLILTNKTKILKIAPYHPDYYELQKIKPKLDFGVVEICQSISSLLWELGRNGRSLKVDYPGFDHDVDGDNPKELFKNKLEKCGSLHSICHVLNEKLSDKHNRREDNRWQFYFWIGDYYEDYGLDLGNYHYKDMEHYIIYNDKQLTNKLLKEDWLK